MCIRMLLLALMMLSMSAYADKNDEAFLRAKTLYQQRQLSELKQTADRLETEQYLLAPYVRYWQLLLTLNEASDSDFENFLKQYPDLPFSDKVKAEWLKQLAKRQDWMRFFSLYQTYSRDDVGVVCLSLLGRAAQGDVLALMEGREIWAEQNDSPSACLALYDSMQQNQVLNQEDLWRKFRFSLRDNQLSNARMVLARIQGMGAAQQKKLERMFNNPQDLIKNPRKPEQRLERELDIYALSKIARKDWDQAQKVLAKIQAGLSDEEQNYLAQRMATVAAIRLDNEALSGFEKLANTQLDELALAWKTRAALRAKQWDVVIASIREMPKKMQDECAWRYWLGRALKEKKEVAKANTLFIALAKERNFYGVLAEEEMGDVIRAPAQQFTPSEIDVDAVRSLPAMQRSVELERLGLRWESRAEWSFALRGMNDKQLLAAAEFASRNGWVDVAINTAEKTQQLHNDALRFPMPFRDVVESFSQSQQVDMAWVYGLSRQESRFNLNARSGVGASGMMQVMPATAKWIAKQNGWKDVKADNLHQLDTNVRLGTYYLRYTLDTFAGQTPVATAAYNAGPGRVRNWAMGQPMEGAIYAETIPILETRLYVQKVMLNTYYYAQRIGKQGPKLKQLLGTVSDVGQWRKDNQIATEETTE
jgi:soluble lytic murein transglycosylase